MGVNEAANLATEIKEGWLWKIAYIVSGCCQAFVRERESRALVLGAHHDSLWIYPAGMTLFDLGRGVCMRLGLELEFMKIALG